MKRTGEKNSRGRRWTRNEDILVMDAYVSGVKKRKDDSRYWELCKLLDRASDNSVYMRFGNFIAIATGKGLKAGKKLVQPNEVWNEFADDRARLKSTAAAIRKRIKAKQNQKPGRSQEPKRKVSITVAPEGKPLPRSHTARERNSRLVREKKGSVLQETGRLVCEACGFDFVKKYGERGEGFIECHHTKPLRDLKPQKQNSLGRLGFTVFELPQYDPCEAAMAGDERA